jgi:hypothetical protein
MERITAHEVNELATRFLTLGSVLGQFRRENYSQLSPTQNQVLEELCTKILKEANDNFTWSSQLVLEDADSSLMALGRVTEQIKATLNSLKDIQYAIDVASSVVALGGSILDRNPKAILRSLQSLESRSAKFM